MEGRRVKVMMENAHALIENPSWIASNAPICGL